MHSVLTLALAFLVSLIGTRRFIDVLAARRLVAVENDRTMHAGAIPQGGGTPVMAALVVATLAFSPWTGALWVLLPLAIALAVMSAINDRRDIAFPIRLAGHGLAASLALTLLPSGQPIIASWLPIALDRLLLLLGLVWFINLTNFMDGIDGITGVEMMSIAAGAVAVSHVAGDASSFDGLEFAIVGASAGFLVWNWHKARIFLGDVGSIPLGLMSGVLLLDLAARQHLVAALVLPLYYLADATLTLLRRVQRGEKVWQPHRQHAYQRAARACGSHSAIVLRIAACNVVLIAVALWSLTSPVLASAMAVTAVGILLWNLEEIAANGPIAPSS